MLSDALEICLEHESHRIEEKWHIEYSISHRDYLPCHRHRNQVPESNRRGCDDREVKGIEIVLSYRISLLESVNEKGSDEPREEKDDSDDDEFAVVEVEHKK